MTFARCLSGLLAAFSISLSASAASELSRAEMQDGLLSINVSADSVSVNIHNNTSKPISVLDTLMLDEAKLPPILSFKIVALDEAREVADLSRRLDEQDWLFPPNYRSYSFAISKKRIEIQPGSFIAKPWSLADILGRYASCEKGDCKFLVKFEARAYPNDDTSDHVTNETPWFVYSAR